MSNRHLGSANKRQSPATWVSDREPWLVLAAVPLLLVPEYVPALFPVAAVILLIVVGCRLCARSALRFGGTLDVSIILLLIMLPVSLAVSSNPSLSFPKFSAMLAGLVLFWSLGTGLRRADLPAAALILALSGIGLAALGLVGTDWPRSKVLDLFGLYDRLPRLLTGMANETRGRVDPNELAGALVMLLPATLGVLLGVWTQRQGDAAPSLGDAMRILRLPTVLRARGVTVGLLLLCLLAMLAVFVLTQSRGAFAALALALVLMLVLRQRRMILLFLVLAVLVVAWDATLGQGRLARLAVAANPPAQAIEGRLPSALAAVLARAGGGDSMSATGRVEIWRNALRAISDYPLTGIGLHTFPAVSWANYVYTVVVPTWNMTHAHNAYLQAGVDYGIAGLVAFLLLVAAVLWRGMRYLRDAPSPFAFWFACGAISGLVGHLVHSLVDVASRPLGDKPGVIFWALAGLLVAADRIARHDAGIKAQRAPARLGAAVAGVALLLTLWGVLVGPLLSIARLDLGALALDQARLRQGLSTAQRTTLLSRADRLLSEALPWRADTVYLRLGNVAYEQGRVAQARAYWAQTPQALPYLLAQGDARLFVGKVEEAADLFASAAAVAPTSSSALRRLANLSSGSDGDAALALLRKALDLDNFTGGVSERAAVFVTLGSILAEREQWGDAVAAYEQAQAISPYFTAQRDLALALYRRDGNAAAAEAYLRAAMRTTPEQVEPYLALMEILNRQGRTGEAIDLGEQTVKRFPEAAEPMLFLGHIYLERQMYDRAQALFTQAVTLRPRMAEPRLALVEIAMARQQPQVALSLLEEAIRMSPTVAAYHAALGDVRRSTGDLAGAATAYRRALELDPGSAQARQGLDSLPK